MADNVDITPGTGATVGADLVSSVLYQRVKVVWGPDGTVNDTDVASGKPMPVQLRDASGNAITFNANAQATAANSAPVVIASDRQNSVSVKVALSTDTSAYDANDLIADNQAIDAFFNKTDGSGVINSITIIDQDAQGVALAIAFMSTTTSLGTENGDPNISDANLAAGLQGLVTVGTGDYITLSGAKVACITGIGLPVKAASGTDDLQIAVISNGGTPTFTATGLNMTIGAVLD